MLQGLFWTCIILVGTGDFDCWLYFFDEFSVHRTCGHSKACQVKDTFMNLFNMSLVSIHAVTGGVFSCSTSKASQSLPTVQTTNHLSAILGLK